MSLESILQQKFVDYSGQQFQKIFYEIMRAKYGTDFEMPLPYGNVGDYKCDGYLKSENKYYACYSPENPYDMTNATAMNSKFESDLKGLVEKIKAGVWMYELKCFVFVCNLKYNMAFPAPVVTKKQELELWLKSQLTNDVYIELITQHDLKLTFNTLSTQQMEYILKKSYFHEEEINFDGTLIPTIIEHFSSTDIKKVELHNIMEFKDKLKFNNLSGERSAALVSASYDVVELENYLSNLDPKMIEKLQSIVVDLYLKSKEKYSNSSDLQFDYIKNNLYDTGEMYNSPTRKSINDTKLTIMAKFFENCTIFESELKI